jgi:cardiolipin synthase
MDSALSWFWMILFLAEETAVAVAVVYVLLRPREARAMTAWILALVLLPVVGLLFFLLFGEPRRGRHRRRRARQKRRLIGDRRASGRRPAVPTRLPPQNMEPDLASLSRLARRLGALPVTAGNSVTIYQDADKTFTAIREAIEQARSHVHLEYYIFQPDETGRMFLDLLAKRASEGIRCRLLLDYVGCWRLSRRFLRPMQDAGVRVAFALPVIPWRGRWRANFRNHRKIAVMDGSVGFTGSQNIGDEYRGLLAKKKNWRDTHLGIRGPAVHQLQEVFVQDWHYATNEDLADQELFPSPQEAGQQLVQAVPSGPDQSEQVMHQLLFAAVSASRSSIRVLTPYFVPDTSIILALQAASYRGVRVQLLIPACSDHRIVLWAGRSYYDELIQAGVEIYEHDDAMLHSKVMIIDDTWAMVGSANMDERSFLLNFELTTILYSQALAQELCLDFESLRRRSRQIEKQDPDERSLMRSLLLGTARLTSPLL